MLKYLSWNKKNYGTGGSVNVIAWKLETIGTKLQLSTQRK